MDREKEYWNEQLRIYNSLKYAKRIRYYEWQPARWAGNYSAISLIKKYLDDVKSLIEVGAGSAAFSIALYNKKNDLKLHAIDISPIATKYGQKISNDLNVPIQYVCGNLFECTGKYDLVLSLGVIEHFTFKQMNEFVEKCIELSNKYILIAIPNQESEFFKNYVSWSNKNSKEYEEKHNKFNNEDLKVLLKKHNLKILVEDGFQLFLSEKNFLEEDTKNNSEIIKLLKSKLMNLNFELGSKFPNVNFKAKDINDLVKVELSFNQKIRMKYSFMSFILVSINEND